MQLKNVMEELVWQKLDEVLTSSKKACNCQKCRYDIAALTLNELPTCYVVTSQGETYSKVKGLEMQFNIDVVTAISNAIATVSSRPHHSDD